MPRFQTAAELYDDIRKLTKKAGNFTVNNYMAVIENMNSLEAATVTTDLFPQGALDFYTAKNMGWPVSKEDTTAWMTVERGVSEGNRLHLLFWPTFLLCNHLDPHHVQQSSMQLCLLY